jgi:hypothetical protein
MFSLVVKCACWSLPRRAIWAVGTAGVPILNLVTTHKMCTIVSLQAALALATCLHPRSPSLLEPVAAYLYIWQASCTTSTATAAHWLTSLKYIPPLFWAHFRTGWWKYLVVVPRPLLGSPLQLFYSGLVPNRKYHVPRGHVRVVRRVLLEVCTTACTTHKALDLGFSKKIVSLLTCFWLGEALYEICKYHNKLEIYYY